MTLLRVIVLVDTHGGAYLKNAYQSISAKRFCRLKATTETQNAVLSAYEMSKGEPLQNVTFRL